MCLYFLHLIWPSSTDFKRQAKAKSRSKTLGQQEESSKRWATEDESRETPGLLLTSIGGKQHQQHHQQQQQQEGNLKPKQNWLSQLWTNCFSSKAKECHFEPDEQDVSRPLLPNSSSRSINNNYNNSGRRHYASNILDAIGPSLLGAKTTSTTSAAAAAAAEEVSSTVQEETPLKMSSSLPSSEHQDSSQQTATATDTVTISGASINCPGVRGGDSVSFKIRTANRRHLDFDAEYDLADTRASARSKWPGPFHFIQAADCQFGMIDSYVHKRTEPGWREEIELCEKLVALCNRMQPRPLFIIICGDLIDSLPASEIGQRQVVDFKRIFAQLDCRIPLVCVCGNHDVGDEPTSETVAQYRQTFGDDYFYFTKNDILFIVINSQFYQHRDYVCREAQEQDEWLEALLARCKLFKYSFVFEHIPWFLATPDEENDYFNIRKEVRLGWLRKFKEAGVSKIMCGHYHRNAGGWFEGMELVVTTAIGAQCGSDQSGIRIVKVFDDTIEHKYYPMQDVPLNIELKKEKPEQPQ